MAAASSTSAGVPSVIANNNTANIKTLVKEDFPQSDQALVDKLAYVINPVFSDLQNTFNKGINVSYLTREYTVITITSVGGVPTPKSQFKTALTKPVGVVVMSATNTTNSAVYVTSAPFISWSLSGTIITINNITGLQDNTQYSLTLEVIA
jgi:hypothetical protein